MGIASGHRFRLKLWTQTQPHFLLKLWTQPHFHPGPLTEGTTRGALLGGERAAQLQALSPYSRTYFTGSSIGQGEAKNI